MPCLQTKYLIRRQKRHQLAINPAALQNKQKQQTITVEQNTHKIKKQYRYQNIINISSQCVYDFCVAVVHYVSSCVYVVCLCSADGQTTMTATIPDTITSWVLSAFAVHSDVGLGVASERAEVDVH